MSTQIENKPTAAFVLSIIGSVIGIIVSLALFALGAIAYSTVSALGSLYGSYYSDYAAGALGWGFAVYFAFGAWCLISSVLVMVFAIKLNANPIEHTKWGALILVFSIIGLGTLFGLIGGILALVYKPTPIGATPQYAPQQQYYGPPTQPVSYTPTPQMRVCPQCGTQMQSNVRFCPNCGKQQN
jgi:hypothetical protein